MQSFKICADYHLAKSADGILFVVAEYSLQRVLQRDRADADGPGRKFDPFHQSQLPQTVYHWRTAG